MRGDELIARYKKQQFIPSEAEITEQMILAHWQLEKQLTQELLESTPETRWEVFDRCYTRLFSELKWLNRLVGQSDTTLPAERYKTWVATIGLPPQKIYEIGSGKGEMILYLAECGFECKATEITHERGQKHVKFKHPRLSWGISDGVHVDLFEPPEMYDAVVSSQVIEHLHPEDLAAHLRGIYIILSKTGRYIFDTPYYYTGPHDISRVFKCDKSEGMHLKEYTYHELTEVIKNTGYRSVYRPVPYKYRKLLSCIGMNKEEQIRAFGIFCLNLMLIFEKILLVIPHHTLGNLCLNVLKKLRIFRDNIFLVAQK